MLIQVQVFSLRNYFLGLPIKQVTRVVSKKKKKNTINIDSMIQLSGVM
jgi:hypothetical protein